MYIKVFVTPGAKKERVEETSAKGGDRSESLRIAVTEPAEQNRANERVREILAARAGVPVGKVRILTGHHSRSKMISIDS